MRAEAAPSAPPLSIWYWCAALAAALYALAWSCPGSVLADDLHYYLAAPRARGEVRVLAIGSSLLMAATRATARLPLGPNAYLNWQRSTRSGLGLGEFADTLALIERAAPDQLVIEANLFVVPDPQPISERERATVRHARASLWRRLSDARGAEQLWATDDYRCADTDAAGRDELRLHMAEHIALLRSKYQSLLIDPALRATVLRLLARGVPVTILDIPRSPEVEQSTGAVKQLWLRSLRAQLGADPHLSYRSAPALPDAAMYCSGGHLRPAFRPRVENWWWQDLLSSRKEAS